MNDALVDDLSSENEQPVVNGKKFIARNWSRLSESTKVWLKTSKAYDSSGKRLACDEWELIDEIHRLEENLGVLVQCRDSQLPAISDKDSAVPVDAIRSNVMSSVVEMTFGPASSEPQFLRLAIEAVRQHQLASSLTRIVPPHNPSPVFKSVLMAALSVCTVIGAFAAPYLFAKALHNVVRGDFDVAVLSCYGLAVPLFCYLWLKNLLDEQKQSVEEIAYRGWLLLPHMDGYWLSTGAGAEVYLRQMVKKGVTVPPVAFDLLALLKRRTMVAN